MDNHKDGDPGCNGWGRHCHGKQLRRARRAGGVLHGTLGHSVGDGRVVVRARADAGRCGDDPPGVTLTVAGAAEAGALTLTTSGTRLVLPATPLSIAGTLIVSPGVPYASLVIGSGWLRFVGESRELFNANWKQPPLAGTWNSPSTKAPSARLRVPSKRVSFASRAAPLRRQATSAPTTVWITQASSPLPPAQFSRRRAISNAQAPPAQSSAITVDGTLATSGNPHQRQYDCGRRRRNAARQARGLTIAGALSYDPGATLAYAPAAAQTTNGETTANVGGLAVENSAGVALSKPVTVTGELALTAGSLAAGSHVVTLGSDAACSGSGDVTGSVQRNSLALATAYCFGHPDVQLTFTSDTLPTAATVTLVKRAPCRRGATHLCHRCAWLRRHGHSAAALPGERVEWQRQRQSAALAQRRHALGSGRRSSGDSSSVTVTGVTAFRLGLVRARHHHGRHHRGLSCPRIDGGVQVTWSTAMEDPERRFSPLPRTGTVRSGPCTASRIAARTGRWLRTRLYL